MLLDMPVSLRKWTRDEYYRLADLGVFRPDERLELIGGRIYAVTPQKTPSSP